MILYSAGSRVNRVQVVLSGFSVRLFCFVQEKNLYVGIWLYVFLCCTRACAWNVGLWNASFELTL